jgi:hypothetical protein
VHDLTVKSHLVIVLSIIAFAHCTTRQRPVENRPVDAVYQAVTVDGTAEVPQPTSRSATYDWIVYKWYECRVEWDQTCEGNHDFVVPEGWQACKFLSSEASKSGSADFRVLPSSWYTNDPQSPDRFRSYNTRIYASGSHNWFNKTGSWIREENVGVRLISAEAVNADRYAAGCDMPPHD